MFKHSTVAEIEAYAATVRDEFESKGFKIDPNRYGVRAECTTCHESATLDPELWMRGHSHWHNTIDAHTPGRTADFEKVTHNADGTRNRVLYYL